MVTLLGTWISGNKFVDEDGVLWNVITYNYLYDLHCKLFPFKCFITLEDNRRIIAVMPLEDNTTIG